MCAQFLIKTNAQEIEKLFGISPAEEIWDERILPYTLGHVITNKGIRKMNFSLIPLWLKERKPKFATHNARIETIHEKPTWKKPLETKRCLIPLSTFIEPIYVNEFAGNMVGFTPENSQIVVAAGIYDEWVDKETGEIIESFSIITTAPYKYIEQVGHDRSPVFLDQKSFNEWIAPKPVKATEAVEFLMQSKIEPNFTAQIDRPMKPGWEKRK